MRLTGRAKELFEDWLRNKVINPEIGGEHMSEDELLHNVMHDHFFDELPSSLQWGLYQDFADSLDNGFMLDTYFLDTQLFFGREKWNRASARIVTIAKFNDLINEDYDKKD